ncbi:DMT family transporter [Brevibacillus humidisoli]|uniref:DMT family transporter n=1 Tax=Brevibacillus humidisoli TaxID=2895522 RepID=UPI001E62552C|nr:DMT family transporter [Brevibacillus humidisoli]UFJ40836.1 DMT family transporter [Brevibacillus humidisoli]
MEREGNTATTTRGIYLVLLLVPLFWGGSFGASKHVVTEIPPFTTAAIRFGIASVLLAIWLTAVRGWDWQVIRRRWIGLLVLSLTGVFAYNFFFFLGLSYTSATNGALVVAINPVFMTLIAVLFLGEAWSGRLGLGVLLSLTGVLLVITGGSWETLLNFSFNKGDLLLFGAVASWVAYGIAGKIVMRGVSPLLTTTVTTIAGTLLLAVSAWFEGGWSRVPGLSGQSIGELLYIGVFATVIAFVLWNEGVHRIGASKASAYINLVPINAMWTAALFYGESVSWAQLIGMVLVIGGVLLTSQAPQRQTVSKVNAGAAGGQPG